MDREQCFGGHWFEEVRVQAVTGDSALTHAANLANQNAVSFSLVVEKYCHSTAMSDAARVLAQRVVTAD